MLLPFTMCTKHVEEINKHVEEAGLSPLRQNPGTDLKHNRAVMEGSMRINEDDTIVDLDVFDPSLVAIFMLTTNVGEILTQVDPVRRTGMYIASTIIGPACPVCLMVQMHPVPCADPTCNADYTKWPAEAVAHVADMVNEYIQRTSVRRRN